MRVLASVVGKSSLSWFYCGACSHMKMIKVPEVEVYESLTVGECRGSVNKTQFQTQDGTIHPLIIPGENVMWSENLRSIHAEGSISCNGESLRNQ